MRGPDSQLGRVTEPCRVGCGSDGGDGEGRGRGRERPEADGRPQGQRRSVGTVPQDGAHPRSPTPSSRKHTLCLRGDGRLQHLGDRGTMCPRQQLKRRAPRGRGQRQPERGSVSPRSSPSVRSARGRARFVLRLCAPRTWWDGSASRPLSKQERQRLGQRLRNTRGTSGGGLARLPRRTRVACRHGTCRRGRLPARPGSARPGEATRRAVTGLAAGTRGTSSRGPGGPPPRDNPAPGGRARPRSRVGRSREVAVRPTRCRGRTRCRFEGSCVGVRETPGRSRNGRPRGFPSGAGGVAP